MQIIYQLYLQHLVELLLCCVIYHFKLNILGFCSVGQAQLHLFRAFDEHFHLFLSPFELLNYLIRKLSMDPSIMRTIVCSRSGSNTLCNLEFSRGKSSGNKSSYSRVQKNKGSFLCKSNQRWSDLVLYDG